ncbi:MAG: 3-phosphoshikimate 1-carboxyvinyltransferase [Bacteroidetes bacterium]|jgi:3-phosphoshikimate 1-carboxyvinyltransferase|nr:3-phosphoshikimate 1-carboxyvinyltransferase [Bacteroidota bacterium]
MRLRYNKQPVKASISLPGSKSISNRLLILQEVLNLDIELNNLSTAKDTQDLLKILSECNPLMDVGHAGTDMRFLTALFSNKTGEWTLTGSERMKERPIKHLVDALRSLGADISYMGKEGFPPLKIKGKELLGGKIEIDGNISSQFISALLLVAPSFKNGLELKINNDIVSWSYIQMTIDILQEFDVKVAQIDRMIKVLPYNKDHVKEKTELTVESDWSSASYWYSVVALNKTAEITLVGLNRQSSQGDSALFNIYKDFGVSSVFRDGNIILTNNGDIVSEFEYDFSDCPDIAQTVAVTCLAMNIPCNLNGLSTLKHKETDRLTALKNEIKKFGVEVNITNDSLSITSRSLKNSKLSAKAEGDTRLAKEGNFQLSTYSDHRMAMSFAPLALLCDLEIEDAGVVEKSYPQFWTHLSLAGINSF